ncbi:hypothetical protein RRG08_067312 [Elysia crispata]|uniref:Uncharacterized protein n=1 Tax=Elysia crispata TaxID=231223 RepID=A0AAE1DZ85_9GAST|nr:hypothetical protein RRG08_067312 [Elysia crispata]
MYPYSREKRLLEMSLERTANESKQCRLSNSSEKPKPQDQISSILNIPTPWLSEKPKPQDKTPNETPSILNISTSQLIELPENLDLSVSGDDFSLSDLPPLSAALKVATYTMNECSDKICNGEQKANADSVVHDMDDENSEKIFDGVANDITFQESDDISARDDNNMFRFINLGERETLPVRSIGALIHNVKECDGEPNNQMIANYCADVVGNGIVRREVDVPAEYVGEIVESTNVVETGNVSTIVVSEIVNREHFVEFGDVPARDVGENVAESIYVLQELLNVVESEDVPARDFGEILGDENVVESEDVPAGDFGEILGDENVVESGYVPGRDVGKTLGDESVVESGDMPGRDVGEILGDENVMKSGDVPARDVGENVMESGDLPARDIGEIVDGENLVESKAKDVHSSRDEASCAEFSEALTYNEDANASMPQSNAVSKLSKNEEKKQSRQFGKAYVSQNG